MTVVSHRKLGGAGRTDLHPGDPEAVTLEAGLLWHSVTARTGSALAYALKYSLVPANPDPVELMHVTLTNTSDAASP